MSEIDADFSPEVHRFELEALDEELNSVLRKLAQVLAGQSRKQNAAWWLCANHARFIIDHPNLGVEKKLIDMAAKAGPPPKGKDWPAWFERVRNLKPHDILRKRH